MAQRISCFIVLLIASLCFIQATAQSDVWNRIVRLESNLNSQDYPNNSTSSAQSDIYRGLFSLEIYSNQTFTFAIYYNQPAQSYVIRGKTLENENFSLTTHSYQLLSKEISGSAVYEIHAGLKWSFSLQVRQRGLRIVREEVRWEYVNWIALIIFGLGGFLVFPLVDRARNKLVYNIRKRTHPVLQLVILFKFGFIWGCYLFNCYHYIVNLPWYYIFPIYGLYILTMAPSLIHAIYFLSSLQNQIKDMDCFKYLGVNTKCLLMSAVFLSIPATLIFSLFIHKGVVFYFGMSVAVVWQFVHSCRQKKYTFTGVLFYDLMLTVVLSMVSLFLPSLNFSLLTWKETVVFWNYYLGLLILGVLLSTKVIKLEIVEDVYLQQESTFEPRGESESERRQENHKMPTIEMIQS